MIVSRKEEAVINGGEMVVAEKNMEQGGRFYNLLKMAWTECAEEMGSRNGASREVWASHRVEKTLEED